MSQPTHETSTMGENNQLNVEEGNYKPHNAKWVLKSPDPPGLLDQIFSSAKETIALPFGKNSSSKSPSKQSPPMIISFLEGLFPILSWGRNYEASMLKNDLMAGLTLASLSIPQCIGYANLAKLDPQYGLYTSVVPPFIYAVMGSSREIAIGPVAVVSMLLSSMVQKVKDPMADPIGYRNFVFTVTFFAGTFQVLFGLFRLGFLVDFLSHAAVVGFMVGAAIVIGLQQLKGLLGISHFTTRSDIVSVLKSVLTSIQHPWSPLNFVLRCSFLIFLLIARHIGREKKKFFWIPAIAPLFSVILSTLVVFLTRGDKHGIIILKHIKRGLNQSSVQELQLGGPQVGEAAKIGLIAAVIALTSVSEPPVANTLRTERDAHKKLQDDVLDVACLMLATTNSELQKQHENMEAYGMIEHLKQIY